MEGYSSENTSSDKKDDKSEKKAGKAAGLGGRTFEFANKKATAEKIADSSSIWEKLIPKDSSERPKEDSLLKTPEVTPKAEKGESQSSEAETAEAVNDPTLETLTPGEKAEVVKDYVQEKTAELESGRTAIEEPAEAAAREANIEFLKNLEADAESTRLEPVEAQPDQVSESHETESVETPVEQVTEPVEGPAELAHDEAIELNVYDTVEQSEDTQAAVESPSGSTPKRATNQSGTSINMPPAQPVRGQAPYGEASFNTTPMAMNPNTGPTAIENHYHESNEGAYFLAGGILGYLLGRRRGRIKTERRMKAVSQKLEKQVNETRQQIARQETAIREQARERYNQTHGPEHTTARTETNHRPESITELIRTESKVQSPERQAPAERVQRMTHGEVLAVAEKVVIEGTSLRTIYEAKQITEPGLRRLTREYLNGGDLRTALKQELQIKEMQYERDPQMRDRLAASYAGVDAAQPTAAREALATLLAQNDMPARTQHANTEQTSHEADVTKQRGHQLLISAWAVLVVVLVIVAVVLAMR